MSKSYPFLVEIGTEELPPKALTKLALAFANNFEKALTDSKLEFDNVEWFAAPRRLALKINALSEKQPDQVIERKGPNIKAAFDKDGKPTQAAIGFAKSCKVEFDKVETLENEKGSWLFYKCSQAGKDTTELLPDLIKQSLSKLPIPKPMRWGNNETQFIRPVHWVMMIFKDKLVPGEILGKVTDNISYGHRFHSPKKIKIKRAEDYKSALEKAFVIVDFNQRKQDIKKQIESAAKTLNATAVVDEKLLDEVTGLVEWPVALVGKFDQEFLKLPPEVLITTIEYHQKYFHLVDKENNLIPNFITISNIKSKKPEEVIIGNERVVRARLKDAEFFYQIDSNTNLESRLENLTDFVFQSKLGSMYEKVMRVTELSEHISLKVKADTTQAKRAALLSKSDLLSKMVGEFPELQGLMGFYFAKRGGEDDVVATAIKEHYLPRFSGDELPKSLEGCTVALADRIDSLVGIFGVNKAPTGEKDPFGLRRAAIGIIRILIEKEFDLDILELLRLSVTSYQNKLANQNVVEEAYQYIIDRLRAWYVDQGVSVDVLACVIARKLSKPFDIDKRVKAVTVFRTLPQAEALAAANKRVSNILNKQEKDLNGTENINPKLLIEDAEKGLAELIDTKLSVITPLYESADYEQALTELATLREPVDKFFDEVMVMVDDEKVRHNRLILLSQLRNLFLQVADISLLQ